MAIELWGLSAIDLTTLLARGDVPAEEAVEAIISRIEAVNPKFNAIIFKRYDLARTEARAFDSRCVRGESIGLASWRTSEHKGIHRGCRYVFDIRHTRSRSGNGRQRRSARESIA